MAGAVWLGPSTLLLPHAARRTPHAARRTLWCTPLHTAYCTLRTARCFGRQNPNPNPDPNPNQDETQALDLDAAVRLTPTLSLTSNLQPYPSTFNPTPNPSTPPLP